MQFPAARTIGKPVKPIGLICLCLVFLVLLGISCKSAEKRQQQTTLCTDSGKEVTMKPTLHVKPRYYRWHVDPGVKWVETNTGYAHLDWNIPIDQAALVVLDVWNRHYLEDTLARSEKIIKNNIRPLVDACRQAGMQVIFAPNPKLAREHPAWVNLVSEKETTALQKAQTDSWPTEEFRSKHGIYRQYDKPKEPREPERKKLSAGKTMHPDVQPVGTDVTVATGEELHRFCKQKGILFLFYVGFNTNCCILMRDYGTQKMWDRGYTVTIVRDGGTAMESFETQDQLLQTKGTILYLEMFGKYSVTSKDIIAGLPK